jgi:hypothetical protein
MDDIEQLKRKQDVALNVRSTIADYMMYWHKICLELSILVSSGIVAVSTFGVDRSQLSSTLKYTLVITFILAAAAATWLILKAAGLIQDLRGILVRVDKYNRLFEVDAYLPGESLYPPNWEKFDAVRMDVIPKWSIAVLVATTGVVCYVLLAHS